MSSCGLSSSNAEEQTILWQIKMGVQSVQGHILSTETDGKTDRNGLGYFSPATPPGEGWNSAWCVPAAEPGDAVCCPAALQLPARVKCDPASSPACTRGWSCPSCAAGKWLWLGTQTWLLPGLGTAIPSGSTRDRFSSHLLSLAKQTRLGEN